MSSSHIHQHISHVHYAVYQWLGLMDVGARACARMRSSVVLSMYVSVSNFLSLSFHICSTFFFFFLSPALLPAATFIKSSAFDLERRWFESQLNAFM